MAKTKKARSVSENIAIAMTAPFFVIVGAVPGGKSIVQGIYSANLILVKIVLWGWQKLINQLKTDPRWSMTK